MCEYGGLTCPLVSVKYSSILYLVIHGTTLVSRIETDKEKTLA